MASGITSAQSAPASTLAVRATGSTRTPLMREVFTRTPPSQRAPTPCPVAITPTPIPSSRAKETAAITSAAPSAMTTSAGS